MEIRRPLSFACFILGIRCLIVPLSYCRIVRGASLPEVERLAMLGSETRSVPKVMSLPTLMHPRWPGRVCSPKIRTYLLLIPLLRLNTMFVTWRCLQSMPSATEDRVCTYLFRSTTLLYSNRLLTITSCMGPCCGLLDQGPGGLGRCWPGPGIRRPTEGVLPVLICPYALWSATGMGLWTYGMIHTPKFVTVVA
jgi:hypothetical protein